MSLRCRSSLNVLFISGCLLVITTIHGRFYGQQNGSAETSEYFPKNAFDKNVVRNQSKVDWYGSALKHLMEPSLLGKLQADANYHAYRFLLLRSFRAPVSIRITARDDGSADLVAKLFEKSEQGKGESLAHRDLRLPNRTMQELLEDIGKAGFWQMEAEVNPTPLNGEDGSKIPVPPVHGERWILEGVKYGKYHIVDRWSPDPVSKYAELGSKFLRLAELKF